MKQCVLLALLHYVYQQYKYCLYFFSYPNSLIVFHLQSDLMLWATIQ